MARSQSATCIGRYVVSGPDVQRKHCEIGIVKKAFCTTRVIIRVLLPKNFVSKVLVPLISFPRQYYYLNYGPEVHCHKTGELKSCRRAICIPLRASSALTSMGEQSKHFTVPTTTGAAAAERRSTTATSATKAQARTAARGTRGVPMLAGCPLLL
jgi:hypothetical protein